uniref:F-box domain-containing protein n=1 Tax=Mycena chlorophos TaxID=658473 RepID=A0ABQ0LZM0_MYCCL|nr:predicted protein [Mycena chlorophos]
MSTTVHRIFFIPELVRLVVQYFNPETFKHAVSLARLARTSRTIFHDAALDVLWHTQDGLNNLFRLLPDDLVDIDETYDDVLRTTEYTMTLTRPVLVEDLARLQPYAARIRSIDLNEPLLPTQMTPCIRPVLAALRPMFGPEENLLPNVQRLRWYYDDVYAPYLALFLSPQVVDLQLGASPCATVMEQITSVHLRRLRTFRIQDKEFSDDQEDRHLIQLRSRMVLSLKDLETGHFQTLLIPEAIVHLGNLPKLRDLYLYLHRGEAPMDLRAPMFSSLRDVTLFGPFEGCLRIIQSLDNVPIHRVHMTSELEVSSLTSNHDADRILRSISTHCSPQALSQLSLHFDLENHWPQAAQPTKTYCNSLEILFSFPNITHMSIQHTRPMEVTDEFLAKVAMAWPRLEELGLSGMRNLNIDDNVQAQLSMSKPSLAGIITLAEACEGLNSLTLSLDASVVPPLPAAPTHTPEQDSEPGPLAHGPRPADKSASGYCRPPQCPTRRPSQTTSRPKRQIQLGGSRWTISAMRTTIRRIGGPGCTASWTRVGISRTTLSISACPRNGIRSWILISIPMPLSPAELSTES